MTNETSVLLSMRKNSAWARLPELGLVEITGSDAAAFMHGRTTSDVKRLEPGSGQPSAMVNRKGHLVAVFNLYRLEDRFLLLTDRWQIPDILKLLDTYRFREKVEFEDVSKKWSILAIQGPASKSLISRASKESQKLSDAPHSIMQTHLFSCDVTVIEHSVTGEAGYLLVVSEADCQRISSCLEGAGCPSLSESDLETLRIEAGILRFGVDISTENLLPETGLEATSVSYDKGCFEGQEVLARIKTYGAPRQALVGLAFESSVTIPFAGGTILQIKTSGEPVRITSSTISPSLGKVLALAYVSREHRVPDRDLIMLSGDREVRARVSLLPFLSPSSPEELAWDLYQKALQEFTAGSETRGIELTESALELFPEFPDAWESLGVMLSRHDRLDEAIASMNRLLELDPESVMAHANLSMFYMQQGDKDRAEEEKAKAMELRMVKLAREMKEKQASDELKQKKIEEARGRLSMFEQVLKLDAGDLLANYGLGDAYVQLGDYEQAIPYLQKALQVKPSYTVAYLALGKALEELKNLEEACRVYEQGIEVAAKRGDLSPMNQMKARLMEISRERIAERK